MKFKNGDRVVHYVYGPGRFVKYGDKWGESNCLVDFDGREHHAWVMGCNLTMEDKMEGKVEGSVGSEIYQVTGEALRRMAEKCPTAASVLKEGFPSAFEEKWVSFVPKFDTNGGEGNTGITILDGPANPIGVVSTEDGVPFRIYTTGYRVRLLEHHVETWKFERRVK